MLDESFSLVAERSPAISPLSHRITHVKRKVGAGERSSPADTLLATYHSFHELWGREKGRIVEFGLRVSELPFVEIPNRYASYRCIGQWTERLGATQKYG